MLQRINRVDTLQQKLEKLNTLYLEQIIQGRRDEAGANLYRVLRSYPGIWCPLKKI